MLTKRFGLAKITKGDIETPLLLETGKDIEFRGNNFRFLDYEIHRDVLYPPDMNGKEIKINEDIYLIPYINTRLKNTRDFVDYTIKLREKLGFDKLFYASGIPPHLIPILTYLGYDIFDDSLEHIENYSLVGRMDDAPPLSKFMMSQTKMALEKGLLRELVESIADNKAKEILRYLDMNYYSLIENFYPIWNPRLNAVTLDSLYRPDVRRWLKRLKERYKKPSWAKYLLLIPCSAKKPYSISKSHKEMREHIKSTMHEVILTSPLALVPRELERFYPAQNYDIPVIGYWYEEEKKLIRDTLEWYLSKFEYEDIISFLPESMKFLEDILNDYGAYTIWGKNYKELEKSTKKLDYQVPRNVFERENFKSLARFQFGCCEELLDGAKIKGRYYQLNIWKDGKRIFSYNPQKGMLTLTEESAKCLARNKKYTVYIENFYPEGDVFAAGILNATEDIREEDEVAVVYENELRGWGIAKMSYIDMLQQKKGKAVKIRGKLKTTS